MFVFAIFIDVLYASYFYTFFYRRSHLTVLIIIYVQLMASMIQKCIYLTLFICTITHFIIKESSCNVRFFWILLNQLTIFWAGPPPPKKKFRMLLKAGHQRRPTVQGIVLSALDYCTLRYYLLRSC